MRLKSIGVVVTTLLAAVTMLYWFTDGARREAIAADHAEELAAYGEVIFSDDDTQPAAAGCARCHGDDGMGGEIPNDPDGRRAPSLHTASLAQKLKVNPDYVRLAVSYGGVVVSGNVNSPMPAWSSEVGGPLNVQQIEAVVSARHRLGGRGRRATPRRRFPIRSRRARRSSTPPAASAATGPS